MFLRLANSLPLWAHSGSAPGRRSLSGRPPPKADRTGQLSDRPACVANRVSAQFSQNGGLYEQLARSALAALKPAPGGPSLAARAPASAARTCVGTNLRMGLVAGPRFRRQSGLGPEPASDRIDRRASRCRADFSPETARGGAIRARPRQRRPPVGSLRAPDHENHVAEAGDR
jgi:hypothetical protein